MVDIVTRTRTITLKGVHDPAVCAGRSCILHSPLVPTETRYLTWRGDRGFFGDVCEHGVGHPTAEDCEYWDEKYGDDAWAYSSHGCDGCELTPGWPRQA